MDSAVEILGSFSLTGKKYFQMQILRLSFARPQNTQIFLLLLEEIKVQITKTYSGIFSRTNEISFLFRIHIT